MVYKYDEMAAPEEGESDYLEDVLKLGEQKSSGCGRTQSTSWEEEGRCSLCLFYSLQLVIMINHN